MIDLERPHRHLMRSLICYIAFHWFEAFTLRLLTKELATIYPAINAVRYALPGRRAPLEVEWKQAV